MYPFHCLLLCGDSDVARQILMDKKIKFKSGINLSILLSLIIYHILMILPIFLNKFLVKDVISWCSYLLLAVDVAFLLPLLFNTYYSLEDTYLFVFQWPFCRLKINYDDIFIIDNEFPVNAERKFKKKYGFTKRIIVIGYYAEILDRKAKKTEKAKKYIAITPSDYDAFMIRIGSKFTSAKKVAEKLEESILEKEIKHKKTDRKFVVETVASVKKKAPVISQEKKNASQGKSSEPESIIVSKGVKNLKIRIVDDDDNKKDIT